MKSYVKPTIEIISMRTSENIADNNIIKTIYTKAANESGYTATSSGYYDSSVDTLGSNPAQSGEA